MLTRTVTFENLNGDTVTKDYYFNVTKRELLEMTKKWGANPAEHLRNIAESKDVEKIVNVMDEFLLDAYGVPTADGEGFTKNAQVREDFSNSLAYAELFEQLLDNPIEFADFMTNLITGIKWDPEQQKAIDEALGKTPELSVVTAPAPQQSADELIKKLQSDPVLAAQLAQNLEAGG